MVPYFRIVQPVDAEAKIWEAPSMFEDAEFIASELAVRSLSEAEGFGVSLSIK
jgi:hypothetical protein